ncbi:MAG: UpxY family transcription antiterminator [Leptospira sp.]|nr:UpxY family transcription antiterminator [Leptospira sp.]
MSKTEPIETESNWYILYTNPRSEKKLSSLFRKYKIESYLPLRKERKKWTDRFKWIETPLFPSYIFVKILFWQDRVKVLQLPGAHHFVFLKGVPATVSQSHLDVLEQQIAKYSESLVVGRDSVIQKGKFVKVIRGPFKGHTLEILNRKNKVNVILRFAAMDIASEISVNIEDIAWEELL